MDGRVIRLRLRRFASGPAWFVGTALLLAFGGERPWRAGAPPRFGAT